MSPGWTVQGQPWVTGEAEFAPLVERPAAQVQPDSGSWYYCTDPAGYYPHVTACNRPWMSVAPFDVQGQGGAARPAQ